MGAGGVLAVEADALIAVGQGLRLEGAEGRPVDQVRLAAAVAVGRLLPQPQPDVAQLRPLVQEFALAVELAEGNAALDRALAFNKKAEGR